MAEREWGEGRHTTNFSLINLGTGMRVINVIDGKVQRGARGMAGEIGFIDIDDKFTDTTQHFDSLVAGKGLNHLSKLLNSEDIDAEEIFKRGTPNLLAIFTHYIVELLLQTTYFYNPETVVFTGSLAKAENKWLPKVVAEFDRKLYPKLIRPDRVVVSKVEDSASFGALLLD